MAHKYVYLFSEGSKDMRNLLGGKGANLAEMTNLGMPVPQGFTITTEACIKFYDDGEKINDEILAEIDEYVEKLQQMSGKKFGDLNNPLLVSVRSGARASMPGMMDTILNLGLNDTVVEAFARKTGNPRFAYDSYRRFIQMYSDVVMEVGKKYFEELIDEMKAEKGVKLDTELDANDLKKLAEQFKAEYKAGLPLRSQGAAAGRHQGRVPFLEQPPRHLLSPHERYPRRLGHCRQRADDGLRQHRQRFRHRRSLHP